MDSELPLNKLCKAWLKKINRGLVFKREKFQDDADTAMKFFTAGKELNEHLWKDRLRRGNDSEDEEKLPSPRFRILVAKVAELVQLFGPALYHRNPSIIVEPKTIDLPMEMMLKLVPPEMIQQAQMMAQQQGQPWSPESMFPPDPAEAEAEVVAHLVQYYLNYMQRENDKKTHSRRMIDEALIKGMGVLWTEQYEPFDGGPKLIGSFYDSVDNLVIDPDCETIEEAKWIARRCVHPVQDVAFEYGLKEDFLREKYGTHESADHQEHSEVDDDGDRKRQVGESNDLIEYWKIYSKMGMGTKLKGLSTSDEMEEVEKYLDEMGTYSYIVVAGKVPFPLNLHHKVLRDAMSAKEEAAPVEGMEPQESPAKEKAFLRCQWPVPFWADGSWPFTYLAFHEIPNSPWPMSHIKPGLGYLEFITWCMSFLVNRIRTSCRTVVTAMKSLESEITDQLLSGKDFPIIKVPDKSVPDGDINKAVHFLDIPQTHVDTWKVLEAVFDAFERATGLNDLLYGAQGGFRSATEVNTKASNSNVRPDDMANKVEDCMSVIARKEAMAARWLMEPEEVAQVMGQRAAGLWQQYVQSGDINKVAREFHYRVEAGSTRKPNKETRQQTIVQAIQQWQPLIQWCLGSLGGNPDATRIMNSILKMWCDAFDVESKDFMFGPPPPPPPNPMQQKIEAEMQLKQQEAQIKQQESQQKLQFQQEELNLDREKMGMELKAKEMQIQVDMEKAANDIQIAQMKARMDMQLGQQKMQHESEMQQQKAQLGQQELQQKAQLGQQEIQLDAQKAQNEMQVGQQQVAAELAQGAQKHEQELKQGAQAHEATLSQQKQVGSQKIKQGDAESKAKIQAQKAQAAAKPKPQPKKKPKP